MRRKRCLSAVLLVLLVGMMGCGNSAQNEIETDTTEDIPEAEESEGQGTENEAAAAPASEDESSDTSGTLIQDQTFQVDLREWGNVTFAAYAPENSSFATDGMNPDVRFYLMKDGQILYEFPGWNEDHTNSDLFLSVSAVAFKDYNEDGLDDVITICEYETMSGEGYQLARIYFQLENKQGFEEDQLLTEYLLKNHLTDSVAAVMDAREDYWDYFASMNGQRSTYSQMQVIVENKDMWAGEEMFSDKIFPGEEYWYAVADLDHNGRYEIIVSNMSGSGRYTRSDFFEINEDYDGLVECETDFRDGGSQPDIMKDVIETYMNDQGEFQYAVHDVIRAAYDSYYETISSLALKDGEIQVNALVLKATEWSYSEEQWDVTCTDASGNSISEEDYENAVDQYFGGWQKSETCLGWQEVKSLDGDIEDIAAQLDQSLNVFLY